MVGPFGLKPKGTMSVRALSLARALVRREHDVTIILPPWSYPEHAGRAWVEGGVRIENTTITPRAIIPFRLLKQTLDQHPDVVHIFKPKAYAGVTQWLVWQLRGVRLARARIVLDTDDWEGAGGWNELEPYSWVQKKFFAWQEQWGLKHADAVTVASRALETIVWSLGQARDRVNYLPNGMNPLPSARISRAQVRVELGLGDAPTILLYTRFFEFKLERLFKLLTIVYHRIPEAKLLVVGQGLFGEEQQLLEQVAARGWGQRVRYAGWIDPAHLREVFAACDVAIYPFDDTLVNRCKCAVKLIDLLASGVPVVAEAVGQNREYIAHGETGRLVPPGNVEDFARNVCELLQNEGIRAQLGSCAAVTVAREYNWDKLAEQAEFAYGVR